jgi:hypothetical protein
VQKDGEGIWDTFGDKFFSFFLKNMDEEGIWGTLKDALRAFLRVPKIFFPKL